MKERVFVCWALRSGDELFYQWGGYPQLYGTEEEAERDIRNPALAPVQVEVIVRESSCEAKEQISPKRIAELEAQLADEKREKLQWMSNAAKAAAELERHEHSA